MVLAGSFLHEPSLGTVVEARKIEIDQNFVYFIKYYIPYNVEEFYAVQNAM